MNEHVHPLMASILNGFMPTKDSEPPDGFGLDVELPDKVNAFGKEFESLKVDCRSCEYHDPHTENYACSVCPVTESKDADKKEAR